MKTLNACCRQLRLHCLLLVPVLVSACASPPIEPTQPPSAASVEQVRATLGSDSDVQYPLGDEVLWGGEILRVENLADVTQVEILGYPLDRRQRPRSAQTAQGRFIAQFPGFVEPLNQPVGSFVTVLGALEEPVSGQVGEADYIYPLVSVEQSHRWRPQDLPRAPRISFGIGIGVGN